MVKVKSDAPGLQQIENISIKLVSALDVLLDHFATNDVKRAHRADHRKCRSELFSLETE